MSDYKNVTGVKKINAYIAGKAASRRKILLLAGMLLFLFPPILHAQDVPPPTVGPGALRTSVVK